MVYDGDVTEFFVHSRSATSRCVHAGRVPPRFWPTRAALQAPLPSLDTDFAMVLGGRGGDRGDGADARHHDGDAAAAQEAALDIDGACP